MRLLISALLTSAAMLLAFHMLFNVDTDSEWIAPFNFVDFMLPQAIAYALILLIGGFVWFLLKRLRYVSSIIFPVACVLLSGVMFAGFGLLDAVVHREQPHMADLAGASLWVLFGALLFCLLARVPWRVKRI